MSGQGIPIQLMVVDTDGFEKVNHDVKLRLTMSNDTSSTAGQYQEVHITQSNEFGIVSVEMGSGISTTNSQVLGISQFTFSASEPFIKVELDTSQSLNQYYEVGHVPYSYPLISRRAFKADSADYANQSASSVFADTADFALNFNESYDGDTSALNELQQLVYLDDTLSLTGTNSKVYLNKNPSGILCLDGEIKQIGLTSNTPITNAFVLAKFHDTLVVRGYYNSIFGYYQLLPSGGINTIHNSGGSITYHPTKKGLLVLATGSGYILNWTNKNNSIDTIHTSNSINQWSYPRIYIEDSSVLILKVANVTNSFFKVNTATKSLSSLSYRSIYNSSNWAILGADSILIGNEIWNYSLSTKVGTYQNLSGTYWIHPFTRRVIMFNSGIGARVKIFELGGSDTTHVNFTGSSSELIPIAMTNDELYFRSNSTISRTINNLDVSFNHIFKADVSSSYSIYEKVAKGTTINEFSQIIPSSLIVSYFEGCSNNQWITNQGYKSHLFILE